MRETGTKLEVPTWLNKEYIRTALSHRKDYDVTIDDMEINMPVPKGNNYATDIYGVKVQYRRSNESNRLRKKSLILKVPIEGQLFDAIANTGLYDKEPTIYNDYSPKLKSVLLETDEDFDDDETEIDDNLLAKSYYSTEKNIVILEDLLIKGYKMVDRVKQLDFDHCVVALKALAKFHAGSVVLHEKEPSFVEMIGKPIALCAKNRDMFNGFFGMNYKCAADHLKGFPGSEKYSAWFEENYEKAYDVIVNEVHGNSNEFKVLNHGDFWLTNMLFKYNVDNKPIKNIPIDLQCCQFASPSVDFVYFIDGSAQDEVRNKSFDNLVVIYLNELNSSLERYGSTRRLTETEFKLSLSKLQYYRIWVNVGNLPGVLADPNKTKFMELKDLTIEDTKNADSAPMNSYFKNEYYLKLLSKRLKEFEKNGLITISPS